MKRRTAWLTLLVLPAAAAVAATPPPAEAARIERLIVAVSQRKDMRFIRNGKEYSCEQAAEFMRGKLKWSKAEVNTVQDFIEHVASKSTTTGEVYQVRLGGGQPVPSGDFLRQELLRIEQPNK